MQGVEGPGLFRERDALQGCQIKLVDDEGAGEVAVDLPDLPFGEVSDKDLLTVHEVEKVDGACSLAEDVAHDRARQKSLDLVLYRGDSLLLQLLLIFRVLDFPIGANHRVAKIFGDPLPVRIV